MRSQFGRHRFAFGDVVFSDGSTIKWLSTPNAGQFTRAQAGHVLVLFAVDDTEQRHVPVFQDDVNRMASTVAPVRPPGTRRKSPSG